VWALQSGTLPTSLALSANGTLSGIPTQTGTFNNLVVKVTDSSSASTTATFSLTINAVQTCTPTQLIGQIQGTGSTSPFVTQTVTTRGIVTGRKRNGFFIQSAAADVDTDPNTSEGIFVFTSSSPTAAATVGNLVCVTGVVQEFVPDANGPSITEISNSPTYFSLSSGETLPAPVAITAADLTQAGPLDPLEKYEGMRVQFVSLTAVAPTQGTINEANATSTSNGVFYAVVTGVARPAREAGIQVGIPLPAGSPPNIPRFDFNPERLRIDSAALGAPALEVTSNAVITNVVGVVDYGFYTTTIDVDPSTTAVVTGNQSASAAATPLPEELTVASFNLERFFDTVDDPSVSDVALTPTAFANRLNKASLAIRGSLSHRISSRSKRWKTCQPCRLCATG
jgi:predicted extracellular nuclease